MAVVRKKQDDKNLKTLREVVSLGGNKQCFDCGQRGPTYVNMTIGSFVCTRCSGVLRGITPPHRVKSISMATFTNDEIEFIKSHGNDECAKTWLGLWDPKRVHTQEHRELMIEKYERKRYYLEPASPLKSLPQHTANTQISLLTNGHNNSQSISNGHQTSSNNNNINNNSSNRITLTPPASLRLNNRNQSITTTRTNGQTSTTTHHFQTQFTPDEPTTPTASLFDSPQFKSNGNINNNNNNTSHNNQNHISSNLNGQSPSSHKQNGHNVATTRVGMNGLSGSTLQNNNGKSSARLNGPPSGNKFTPETEFGADFGSSQMFGNGGSPKATQNGVKQDNANADFADFDHNPIFNASVSQSYTTTPSSSKASATSTAHHHYANINVMSTATPSQWNLWQQFQWPVVPPEQNRWSLPMSISSTSSSLNSNGSTPFNSSNSSINSTPPVDRYAALKDLDEQLREVVKEPTVFGSPATTTNGFNGMSSSPSPPTSNGNPIPNGGVNPFKLVAQTVNNPFQATNIAPAQLAGHASGWATDFGGAPFAANMSQHQMFGSPGGYTNGFSNGYHNLAGHGFGQTQRNPFAATTTGSSSNNPFL